MRLALGRAGRWRIVSLVLSENVVLAAAGCGDWRAPRDVGHSDVLRAVLDGRRRWGSRSSSRPVSTASTVLFAVGARCSRRVRWPFGFCPLALHLGRLLRARGASGGRARRPPDHGGLREVLMAVEVALAVIVLGVALLFLLRVCRMRG